MPKTLQQRRSSAAAILGLCVRRNRGGGAVRVRVGREVRGDLPLTVRARMSATRCGLV